MTEDGYLDPLQRQVAEHGVVTRATLRLVDEAVAAFPNSVRLWCRRGDLIQPGPDDGTFELEDARRSYERALAIDPENAEALEELGHYYDAVDPQPELAEANLRKAITLGATKRAFVSLAELYLERGDAHAAEALLSQDRCPYSSDEEVLAVRRKAKGN